MQHGPETFWNHIAYSAELFLVYANDAYRHLICANLWPDNGVDGPLADVPDVR